MLPLGSRVRGVFQPQPKDQKGRKDEKGKSDKDAKDGKDAKNGKPDAKAAAPTEAGARAQGRYLALAAGGALMATCA